MATLVDPPNGVREKGKHYFSMWETLFEIDTKYVPIKPIGRGSFGVVCSSINRETNEKVAIKKITNVFHYPFGTLREMKLLRHIRHENVIALKDVMMPIHIHRKSFNEVYLVYELMDTDLLQIIKSSQPLSSDHCKYFIFQLLSGLKYVHSANVLHRDLKPDNLLVNANCDLLKICDFGLAGSSIVNEQLITGRVGTRWYRAPELILCCHNYGTSVDVWSVGCIFAEILGRQPIFQGTDCLDQLRLIINILGTPLEADMEEFIDNAKPNINMQAEAEEEEDIIDNAKARNFIKSLPFSRGLQLSHLYPHAHPLALDLLQKMLVFNPRKRITVVEALQHPYMSRLYNDPPSQVPPPPVNLDIDDEELEELEDDRIREMLLSEMLNYHPDPDPKPVSGYS